MKRILYISCICLLSYIQPANAQTYRWQQLTDFYDVNDIKTNSAGDIFICQDNSGIRRSTDGGTTWEFINVGGINVGNLAINDSGHIFASDRERTNYSVYKSTDNGSYWIHCTTSGGRMRSLHISSEQYVYAGNDVGIFFRSFDGGATWSSITVLDKQINTIRSCSNGQIFIGTYQNGIYTSTDFGTTWSHIPNVYGSVSSIIVNDSDYIFAFCEDSIHMSTDYGLNWIPAGYFLYALDPPLGIDSAGTIYTATFRVYKSNDNGQNWISMGGPGAHPTAIETNGRKVYVTDYSNGVYLYDPDYIPPAYVGNYVPLCVGNKWQYYGEEIANMESFSYSLDTLEVIADTLILDRKYFKTNEVNDWIRFSYEDQKLYIRWNDSDYVNMDFTKQPDEGFQQLTFNSHVLRNVTAIRGERQIFDSTLIYKGYRELGYHSGSETRYTESFGETDYSWAFSSETPYSLSFDRSVIQEILIDSTGTPRNYSYPKWPVITFNPMFYTASTLITFDFLVDHPYTRLPPNQISGGLSFIDSVVILGFFMRGDSIIANNPILVPPVYYNHFMKTFQLNDSLFTNGFDFYYKIMAKDKGILPKYVFDPYNDYYKLTYIDTSTVIPIHFSPGTDTIYVNSISPAPQIYCYNLVSTQITDSIFIKAGYNTTFYYLDSSGIPVYINGCSFLVTDSLNQYDYELWYYPKSSPPLDPVPLKYDSIFFIGQHNFDIKLIVKLHGIPVESYSQSFKADWAVNINEGTLLPQDYNLSQNYPNPFNSSTVIKYQIPELSFVNIKVFDLLGREVNTLVNEEKPAGYYQLDFDASNLSTGIYIYRINAGSFSTSRKMILLK